MTVAFKTAVPWTVEQILGLAPSYKTVKSSEILACPEKWLFLYHNEEAIWGEYQERTKNPYQVKVALNGPALACSCASRGLPCQHSIALLLIFLKQPDSFVHAELEDWAAGWESSQVKSKAGGAPSKAFSNNNIQNDKVISDRHDDLIAGLLELEKWVEDIVRNGLAQLLEKPKRFWFDMADRLIDARAVELSRELKRIAGVPGNYPDWPEEILTSFGRMFLLIQGFKRFDDLNQEVQADLRTAVGWLPKQHAAWLEPGVSDRWIVLGRRMERLSKNPLRRTWLWGLESNRPAEIIHVLSKKSANQISHPTGFVFDGEVHYFQSQWPLQGEIHVSGHQPTTGMIKGYGDVKRAIRDFAHAQSANPWLQIFPMMLNGVVPIYHEKKWTLRDKKNYHLPLPRNFGYGWHLNSISGGGPISVFGEWDGQFLLPLSVLNGKAWLDLHIFQVIR